MTGKTLKSYKGGLFRVVCEAQLEWFIPKWGGARDVIVYESLQTGRKIVSLKAEMFKEVKTPDGMKKRFELMED